MEKASDRNPYATRLDLTPVYGTRLSHSMVDPGGEAMALIEHGTCLLKNGGGRALARVGLAVCVGVDEMCRTELWGSEHGGTFGLKYLEWDAFKATPKLERLAKRHGEETIRKVKDLVNKGARKGRR